MGTFESEMRRAQVMQETDEGHAEYWASYMRGLRRANHGETFSTDAEHTFWLSLVDDEDDTRRQRGAGYRDGLKMNSGLRGQPRQFGETELITFRCPKGLARRLPKGRKKRADFLRGAVEEKLERDT